jgi:hypothetical protein
MLYVTIGRDLLGLSPLYVEDPANGYTVMKVGPGARTMRLEHATSPVSDGSVLTGATADLQQARLVIRVHGATTGDVLARLGVVEQALNQWAYNVTIVIDGVTEVWRCQPANHSRGLSGTYEAEHLKGGWQDLTVELPKQPAAYGY